MKVKATKKGFIFGMLMKEGDEFTLEHDKQFSKNWMIKLEEKPAEKPTKKTVKKAQKQGE